MKLYTDDGWLNIPAIKAEGFPFIFITGGRGTGKTYGALLDARHIAVKTGRKFIYLRRTQAQVDILNRPEFSPFKAIDHDLGTLTVHQPVTKYSTGFYPARLEEEKAVITGPALGYSAALSTFANLRGFDGSDVDELIFDEFIPQRQERPIKEEAEALFNCYETVNRNRELAGAAPVQMLCLSNANDMGNPIYISLGLVRQAERMLAKGRDIWTDEGRGIMLIVLRDSPISAAKQDTALYRMTGPSEFTEMALGNTFSKEERSRVRKISQAELLPLVQVGEITIYRLKGERGFYVSTRTSGSPDVYGTGTTELSRFRSRYGYIWDAYLDRKISFSEYLAEVLLNKYMKG